MITHLAYKAKNATGPVGSPLFLVELFFFVHMIYLQKSIECAPREAQVAVLIIVLVFRWNGVG